MKKLLIILCLVPISCSETPDPVGSNPCGMMGVSDAVIIEGAGIARSIRMNDSEKIDRFVEMPFTSRIGSHHGRIKNEVISDNKVKSITFYGDFNITGLNEDGDPIIDGGTILAAYDNISDVEK